MATLKERRLAARARRRRWARKRRLAHLAHGSHERWWVAGRNRLFATKSEWGPGPWQDEPDRLEWRHASGLPCLIVRNHMGALCGYVGVPPEHPLYMRHYDDCRVEAHGGLTFSRHCSGEICHKPEPGEEKDIWWLGFDCAHYRDLMPSMRAMYEKMPFFPAHIDDIYRSITYVFIEVEQLAKQVAAMGQP